MMWRQMPLDWPIPAAMTAENFVIAESNRAARLFIDRWPDWPGPAIAIHGPEGCGKSHLAAIWRQRARAEMGGRDLDLASLPENPRLILDEIPLEEETLFHLLNRVAASRDGYLLILARQAPARWQVRLPDLASRLAALPAIAVAPPDDSLLGALIQKHCTDRQIEIGEDVLNYLLRQMERSFAAARSLVAKLDRASLAAGRRITIPLAREILSGADKSAP